MFRDAIANALQERWPEAKITDHIELAYGGNDLPKHNNRANRINVEVPTATSPTISIRVATIDLNGSEIEATFYGGGKYSHDLFHPQSITDLEELIESHFEQVGVIAKKI